MDSEESNSSNLAMMAALPTSVLIRSVALTGIFLMMLIFCLYAASEILIPMTIAYTLNLLLSPLISKLNIFRIPSSVSAAMVMAVLILVSVFSLYSLSSPAEEWITRAPKVISELKTKIKPLLGPILGAQQAAENVDSLIEVSSSKAGEPQVNVTIQSEESSIETVFTSTSSALASIGIVLVMLYFLLAAGDKFLNKVVAMVPKFEDKRRAVQIIRDIQRDTSRYLIIRTLINLGLGTAVTVAMYLMGMPNPMLWGAMAAILNFAPYVGPATSLVIITIAALISMDTLLGALLVPSVILVINIIEGEFISHHLIGRRLELSPVIVFTSIVFWGWLWGIAGALMAIPIIAAINVICQHIESLNPISEFISEVH